VVAGDQDHRRVGQRLAQPLELAEREDDGRIGRAHGVEQVAGHHHRVGSSRDDAIDGGAKGRRYVGLPLVEAAGSLPVELPEAEVGIGKMGEAHGRIFTRPATFGKAGFGGVHA
jgi:hypothetical protein